MHSLRVRVGGAATAVNQMRSNGTNWGGLKITPLAIFGALSVTWHPLFGGPLGRGGRGRGAIAPLHPWPDSHCSLLRDKCLKRDKHKHSGRLGDTTKASHCTSLYVGEYISRLVRGVYTTFLLLQLAGMIFF